MFHAKLARPDLKRERSIVADGEAFHHQAIEGISKMSWQKLKGLREQRAQIRSDMQGILDKSEAEKRDITSDEKTKFDGLRDKSDSLRTQIEVLEGIQQAGGIRPNEGIPRDGIGEAGNLRDLSGPFSPLKGEWEKRTLANQHRNASDPPLSFSRFLGGALCGHWEGAEAERRAMSTTATGSVIVPTPLSANLIQGAFNQSRVMQAGAQVVPMDSATLKMARISGAPQAGWKAENAAFNVDDSPIDSITFTAHTLGVVVKLSLELGQDAHNSDAVLESAMEQAIGMSLDNAAMFGDGTNNSPTGIASTSGIQSISSVGTLSDYSKFSSAVTKVYNANGLPSACIVSPNTYGALDNLQDTLHQPLRKPDSVANLPFLPTNQIPVQPVTVTISNATAGTFTVSVNAGGSTQTTSGVAYNASAATLKTAIEALSNVGTGNVSSCTGSAGGPYTISFNQKVGWLGAIAVTASGAGLTGSSPTATATAVTSAFVGDFRQCLIAMRQNVVIEASREAADSNSSAWVNGQIFLRCWLRADIQLAHPNQFVQLTGITAV